jgi:hypothetical protein
MSFFNSDDWSWGRAAAGALTGLISTGGNPFGLLMGLPAGYNPKPKSVDTVLPEIDAQVEANKLVAGSGLSESYGRLIGGAASASRENYGNLIASGIDPTTASRISSNQREEMQAAAGDSMLDQETKMRTAFTTNMLPRQWRREDERLGYQNQVDNQPNALQTFGPAVLSAALGNMASGGGLLGRDSIFSSGADTITTTGGANPVATDSSGGVLNNANKRGLFGSMLFGETENVDNPAPYKSTGLNALVESYFNAENPEAKDEAARNIQEFIKLFGGGFEPPATPEVGPSEPSVPSVPSGPSEDDIADMLRVGDDDLPAGLLSLIDRREGDARYDTLWSHAQRRNVFGGKFMGTDVTKMTIDQVLDFNKPGSPYRTTIKQAAAPVGRYQFIHSTLKGLKDRLGLSGDEKFDKGLQDRLFMELVRNRVNLARRAGGSSDAYLTQFRNEWDGLRHVDNDELIRILTQDGLLNP